VDEAQRDTHGRNESEDAGHDVIGEVAWADRVWVMRGDLASGRHDSDAQ